jgi:glyoxylase-like metal-dependent hydrolase (beta-lactamase superfamily II)
VTDENRIYFRQLLSGTHLGKSDQSAAQMANFIYLVGDKVTKECVVIDPAWDIEGLLKIIEDDGMKLTGALVTHYHPDHVCGSIFGMQIQGLPELMEANPVPIFVNKHEAEGVIQVTGVSKSDLRLMDNQDTSKVGEVEISFMHTPES